MGNFRSFSAGFISIPRYEKDGRDFIDSLETVWIEPC